MITLTCFVCQTIFQRPIEWIKNSERRGDKHTFCSLKCFGIFSQKPPIEVPCCECHNIFFRSQGKLNKTIKKGLNIFCSKSCAATYNNRVHPKRTKKEKKIRICLTCSHEYIFENDHKSYKYCFECSSKNKKYKKGSGLEKKFMTITELNKLEMEKYGHIVWNHAHIRLYGKTWNKELCKLPCQKCRLF